MVVKPDFTDSHHGLVGKQGAHGGKLGTPVTVVDGHRGGVLLNQAFRVDAQCGVEIRRGVRQFQHPSGIAGVGRTFQHAHHAARGQRRQQCGAVAVKLAGGIMRVGVKDVVHALVSCGARLTR